MAVLRTEVEYSELRPGRNIRVKYTGIEELAESISEMGLLQALIVRTPRPGEEDKLVIEAGERRYRALGLLKERGLFDSKIPVVIRDSKNENDSSFVTIAENEKDSVPLWHLGHRFIELSEAGYTQKELASKIGRDQNYVSLAIQIARGLHPRIVQKLDKIPHSLNNYQLLRLAKILDSNFEPDADAQLAYLTRLLLRKPVDKQKARLNIPERERVLTRWRKLKRGLSVPSHAMPYVLSVVRYLSGEDARLSFPDTPKRTRTRRL